MAKQTWTVDRKKGGTYSFKLDAQGNYTLQKDGFEGVNTLNLPELKAEAAKTTTQDTTKDVAKLSDQTQKAFGDVRPFYYPNRGNDRRADEQYIDEYQIKKDKSLDTDINQTYYRPNMREVSGEVQPISRDKVYQDAIMRGESGVKYMPKRNPLSIRPGEPGQPINEKSIRVNRQGTEFPRPEAGTIDQMEADYRSIPGRTTVSDIQKQSQLGVRVPDRISSSLRPSVEKPILTQTALKQVNTASNVLAKAVGFVTNPIISVGRMIGDKLVSPQQRQLNERNSSALSALGYKTRGELGSNIDPGRIAGNPADNVFAGMNAQSMRGDVFRGARKRVDNISNTIENLDKNWSTLKRTNPAAFKEKKEKLEKKRDDFKEQIEKAQGEKNKQDIAKGPGALGPAGGAGNGGNGGGGRVICTELHSTGEMSTVDWVRDTRFTFKTLTKSHVKGYLFWAIPTVRHMKKYPLYRKIWKHIAQHRANDIAWRLGESKFDLLGRIYAGIGEPTCWLIGKFVSDKQYNELNLKNWRRV